VFDSKFAMSGAQPEEVFQQAFAELLKPEAASQ